MLLNKRLILQGRLFFKYRGQLPLILLPLTVLLMVYYPMELSKEIIFLVNVSSFLFIFFGHAIRATTVGKRHKHSSGRNRSHHYAENLNTTGWYSTTRNPLYFANFLIWLGLSFLTHHVGVILLICVFFWFIYQRIIISEEDYLLHKFGAYYEEWAKMTPVFFPKLKNFKTNPIPLSLKTILKNEYPGISSTLMSLLLIHIGTRVQHDKGYIFDYMDLTIFIGILLFAGSMKLLKHKTSFFYSED
jgi:protein-S-isoprenylcysteine O-methyltransferase Ste14